MDERLSSETSSPRDDGQHQRRVLLFWIGLAAGAVLVLDEAAKEAARRALEPCGDVLAACDAMHLVGPVRIVNDTNAGSALGAAQGLWIWVVLAVAGVLLVPLFAARLPGRIGPMIGVGLQVGGALSNLIDRLLHGGVTDYLVVGGSTIVFNLADLAVVIGAATSTWFLIQAERPARANPNS